MAHWLVNAYQVRIVEPGREPLFLLLLGLIGSFLFIRVSVRMIRRGVRWWPGNITPGGLHIHHVVFGQALMLVGGIGSFAVRGDSPAAHDALAVLFGIGCGLVLDEFALVLHLEDVYWSEEGRTSVDAVILAAAVIGLLLLGDAPLGGLSGRLTAAQLGYWAVIMALVVVSLLKGKVWTGLLGVMLPPLALVGALRLARPSSPWARWRYYSRPRRLARAERRDTRIHQRLVGVKKSVYNALAGAPHLEAPAARRAPARRAAPAPAVPRPPAPAAGPPGPSAATRLLRPLAEPAATAVVWYLRAAATVDLVGGAVAPFRERVRRATGDQHITPFLVTAGFTAAVLAFLLAVMLRRRKRAAWTVATVLAGGNTALYWLGLTALPALGAHPLNWVSTAVTSAVLLALLAAGPACQVRGERGNTLLGAGYLLLGGIAAAALGTVVVHQANTAPAATWTACFRYALLRILTLSGLFELPDITVPRWTDLVINLLSVALFLQVLRAFFRSPRVRGRLSADDESRLRTLLAVHGEQDSLGYFALRRDTSVGWSPSGAAAVLFRVVNGVALAYGDPVGDAGDWPGAVDGWLRTARAHGWVPGVVGAGRTATAVYERAGLRALAFGDEPVVDVGSFVPAGATRRAHDLIRAAGYRAVVRRQRDIPAGDLDRLVHLADAWRHGRTDRELVMSLGRLGSAADGDCVLVECRDPQDRTCAMLTLVPWGRGGLTLDLMRRDSESSSDLIPYLVGELLLLARAGREPVAAVRRLSLNFAMSEAAEQRGRPRLYHFVVRLLSRRRRLRSLHRIASAFQPHRLPRFMLYERPTELPRIALANSTAEGLVTAPRLRGTRAAARS